MDDWLLFVLSFDDECCIDRSLKYQKRLEYVRTYVCGAADEMTCFHG